MLFAVQHKSFIVGNIILILTCYAILQLRYNKIFCQKTGHFTHKITTSIGRHLERYDRDWKARYIPSAVAA